MELGESFWSGRYAKNMLGWDVGYVSTPLKAYFDQLENKDLRILIPGCGNAYEAEYLFRSGFTNVNLVDISKAPLNNFQKRLPSFPSNQLIHADFFDLNGEYDLLIEQTFFCAINPTLRFDYARKCYDLLSEYGKLMGVLFDIPLNSDGPPFGGSKDLYVPVFSNLFHFQTFEKCYNSIPERQGTELFIILTKHSDLER